MKKFKHEKLVRDKIVKDVERLKGKANYRIMQNEEYINELRKKLIEETQELLKIEQDELIKEMVDVQEIIDNLVEALGFSKEQLKEKQEQKNKEWGSFKKRIYINTVEIPEDSKWVKYYLKNQDRYPEIKE